MLTCITISCIMIRARAETGTICCVFKAKDIPAEQEKYSRKGEGNANYKH